jgi:hypothetical protein
MNKKVWLILIYFSLITIDSKSLQWYW